MEAKFFSSPSRSEGLFFDDPDTNQVEHVTWAEVIDLFAAEYGWDANKVRRLTLHQMKSQATAIRKRHNKILHEEAVNMRCASGAEQQDFDSYLNSLRNIASEPVNVESDDPDSMGF